MGHLPYYDCPTSEGEVHDLESFDLRGVGTLAGSLCSAICRHALPQGGRLHIWHTYAAALSHAPPIPDAEANRDSHPDRACHATAVAIGRADSAYCRRVPNLH